MLRRELIIGGLSLIGSRAFAQSKSMFGDMELLVFSDGAFALPFAQALPLASEQEIASLTADISQNMAMNIVVLRQGVETWIFDCGGGANFLNGLGKLPSALELAGINYESVTRVYLSHAHPDHLFGAIDEFNTPLFPKATYYLHQREVDYWLAADLVAKTPDSFKGLALGTQRILGLLKPQLQIFGDNFSEKGVSVVPAFGHTIGHVAFLLESGSQKLLLTSDALSNAVISFAKPSWVWGMDYDKYLGASSRIRLLDMAHKDKLPILGYHLPNGGKGMVEAFGLTYKFTQGL